jgi:hypothetical protein
MIGRYAVLAFMALASAACSPAGLPALDKHQAARLAILQEALSHGYHKPICLSVDPTLTLLGEGGVVPKEEDGLLKDPDPELFRIVKRPGLVVASQCPQSADENRPQQVHIGPLLVHRSGRVEAKIVYGMAHYPTMAHCVAELGIDETWGVTCRVLWQA